ncbi:DUF6296 family protein [Streptomyces sp. H39-S7]|uniref:DUF6296 family protein n=1 Tax=Streptomyces sp. H39-S7 TaxID=3004357 RepID=UPI0022B04C89|nr:DUF6296 family protein [Streptomyces sp. H39-S7]MCZ4119773.1 DUF6296 family protein [Streptomyces sp. H39-S7]
MSERAGFELIFTNALPAEGTPAKHVVEVFPTTAVGSGGYPIYVDATKIIRAEISDTGQVRMIASGGGQRPQSPTEVHRLPPTGDR